MRSERIIIAVCQINLVQKENRNDANVYHVTLINFSIKIIYVHE